MATKNKGQGLIFSDQENEVQHVALVESWCCDRKPDTARFGLINSKVKVGQRHVVAKKDDVVPLAGQNIGDVQQAQGVFFAR